MRYFDINLPFSLIYSRILIAYIIVLLNTGKSFSEALILESTNPQYDKTVFIDLPQRPDLIRKAIYESKAVL